jgi:hypothetical protein
MAAPAAGFSFAASQQQDGGGGQIKQVFSFHLVPDQ